MRVLFVYNPFSGHYAIKRKLKYIKRELAPLYDEFKIVASISVNHFRQVVHDSAPKYDLLLVSGGDGTVNMTINILCRLEKRPVLGIIPTGTLNDAVKNFGNPTSFKRTIQMIKKSIVKDVDILKVNNRYAAYTACCGAYSDIPLVTSPKAKRYFGRLAYYVKALPRLFKKRIITGSINANGRRIPIRTSFLIVMNGERIAGFRINKGGSTSNGKVDILYSRPRRFNSIFTFLFNKKHIKCITTTNFEIDIDKKIAWDFDGEQGPKGPLKGEILPGFLSILSE